MHRRSERETARFLVREFEPAYRGLPSLMLEARADAAREELRNCHACPRRCGCDRLKDERRTCRVGRHALVSSAFAHHGEEDCLRGWRGSGTIFFGGCNLRCVFCQNADISQQRAGRECTAHEIASLMLDLQEQGCHNVNLVTPEHVVPQLVEALVLAIGAGLRVPVVYNTSAYDSLASLRLLDGLVDIYMPDFKLWSPESSLRYCLARDYPERAREAILEMQRQVGPLCLGPDRVARRGLLVRHLVMPGLVEESTAIFDWLAREVSPDTWINVMAQYRPAHRVGVAGRNGRIQFAEIDRVPRPSELEEAYAAARQAGLWRFDERLREWN